MLNSDPASSLRASWSPLVNTKAVLNELLHEVGCFPAVDQRLEEKQKAVDFSTMEATFVSVRDKVCELSVAKALSRPLKKDEARQGVVQAALKNVAALEGCLPEELQEHLE